MYIYLSTLPQETEDIKLQMTPTMLLLQKRQGLIHPKSIVGREQAALHVLVCTASSCKWISNRQCPSKSDGTRRTAAAAMFHCIMGSIWNFGIRIDYIWNCLQFLKQTSWLESEHWYKNLWTVWFMTQKYALMPLSPEFSRRTMIQLSRSFIRSHVQISSGMFYSCTHTSAYLS